MNLMKKIVFVVLVMAWLLARAIWDLIITFVCLMRVALGKNGELVFQRAFYDSRHLEGKTVVENLVDEKGLTHPSPPK